MIIWTILGIIALICLVISFWMKRNAIWVGLILGAIIAIITAIIHQHDAINSATSKKIMVVCVLVGALFEVIRQAAAGKFLNIEVEEH